MPQTRNTLINSQESLGKLKRLLLSKSALGIGLDPARGVVHVYIKTEAGETHEEYPLKPQHQIYFQALRALVEKFL